MRLALLSLLFAAGCADYSLTENATDYRDSAADSGNMDAANAYIRFDVYPPASLGPDGPPQQSVTFHDVSDDVSVVLEDAIRITGQLSGYDASPYSFVSVPGQTTPVIGYFQATLTDSIVSRKMSTDDAGNFSGTLVRGDDYTLAWIPESPAELPFLVQSGVGLAGDTNLSVELDYGVPLYGRVTHESAVPLQGVAVQAIDPATGIGGPMVTTGEDGRYMLRVMPGDYLLQFTGPDLRILPTKSFDVSVPEDLGLRQDVTYGSLRTVPIRGSVVDSEQHPAENVMIRMTSISLDGVADASLVLELDTASNGIFADDIPPGSYEVEYIPPYFDDSDGAAMGPMRLTDPLDVGGPSTQVPVQALPERVLVDARVLDVSGKAVSHALVRAQEEDFGEYVFEAVTDEEGRFQIWVTDVSLTWSLQPPASSSGAVTFFSAYPSEIAEDLTLSEGRTVTGVVNWQGEVVPHAAVEIRDGLGRLYGSVLTDDAGAFALQVDLATPR